MRIEVENVIIDWIDNRRGELGGGNNVEQNRVKRM